ncbi:BatD family protein, partial [Chitinophagales bacterium]|nr:BatD family protein [Chitinophagales bacterium]
RRNGKATSFAQISYGVQAIQSGKFTIGKARFQLSNKVLESPKIVVNVTGDSAKLNEASEPQPDIFFRIEIDTNAIYQGQQLDVDYVIYSKHQMADYDVKSLPSLAGFWVKDESKRRAATSTAVIANKVYNRYVVREYALFAQRPGELELDGVEGTLTIAIPRGGNRGFFKNYTRQKKAVKCETITVNVHPLPEEGKPNNFSGAVGRFQFSTRVDPNIGKQYEAMQLGMSIIGSGNLMLIEPPSIDLSKQNVELFEPEQSERIENNGGIIMGSKTFSYPIIPRDQGQLEIPIIEFPYFNPKTEQYEIARSKNLRVQIRPGDPSKAPVVFEDEIEKTMRPLNVDSLSNNTSWSLGSKLAVPFICMLPLLYAFLIYRKKEKQDLLDGDVVGRKRREALAQARKRMVTAEQKMTAGDRRSFYDEVVKSLWGYLQDRFEIPAGELTKELAKSVVLGRGIGKDEANQLARLMADCEVALYAPSKGGSEMEAIYNRALEVVVNIEEQLEQE